jgi:acetylornithine deacetylase/succinyl-diaminopimelate desuccinylase-like protein
MAACQQDTAQVLFTDMPIDVAALAARSDIAHALDRIRSDDATTLADMVAATRLPSPTGEEGMRAEGFGRRFADLGIQDTGLDTAGNLLVRWSNGDAETPAVILASHLDTVFPAETDLSVDLADGIYRAPGIADNARGLAALLAVARSLRAADWSPGRPVVFVGTVGEEGTGNLRGVRHLLRDGAALRTAAAFIAVDGTGRRHIVNRAIGSVRLRFEVFGPGGHSWANRHRPNPLRALARAVARMERIAAPGSIATPTRMAGGESVNALPGSAWLEVDMRAHDPDALALTERRVRDIVEHSVARANRMTHADAGGLRLVTRSLGVRPVRRIGQESALVRVAAAATRFMGEEPELAAASTDANVPLSLGMPAITLGAGGRSGGTHTTGEWYDNDGGPEGIQRLALTVVALSEMP